MGNSPSSNEVDEEVIRNGEVEASSSEGEINSVGGRDISPVVSELDKAKEQGVQQLPTAASTSDISTQNRSKTALTHVGQRDQRSPWNMPQSGYFDGSGNKEAIVAPERQYQQEDIIQETNVEEEPHYLGGIGWQSSNDSSPEMCLEDVALATCSFLSSEMTGAILGEDWETEGHAVREEDRHYIEGSTDSVAFGDYSRPAGIFFPWVSPSIMTEPNQRRLSNLSATSDGESSIPVVDFYPPVSENYEWMGRSIETLLVGHRAAAPVLAVPEEESVARTSEGLVRRAKEERCIRRTSISSLDSKRSPNRAARGPRFRRGSSCSSFCHENSFKAGPNVLLSLLAREGTGKPTTVRTRSPMHRLREMGGSSLFDAIDVPSGRLASEVAVLKDAIDCGDWTETHMTISRLAPRLVGDPIANRTRNTIDDPSLPASASRFHAGGGRLGLEREAFVAAGGIQLFLRVFYEPAFVGDEILETNDARELCDVMVNNKLASCWNEVLISLRELVYALPILVENGDVLGEGDFLPFLFTLLAHDNCFDGAATLIEEILGCQSNILQQAQTSSIINESEADVDTRMQQARVYVAPPSTFFLGNVPDLYELIAGFNCRQLAHFCRLLALLIFEPEDRQVLESPSVLKSVELLQLRRDRAARAGRDATVDMNQAIIIGDSALLERLLVLLRIMNFGPPLRNGTAYHIMTHFPFIAATLPMVGLNEFKDFREVDRLEKLARSLISKPSNERLHDLGGVTNMLERLSGSLQQESLEQTTQIGHIINVINAATQSGVVVGTARHSRTARNHRAENRLSSQDAGANGDDIASAVETLANHALQQSLHAAEISGVEAAGVQVVSAGLEESVDGEDPVIHRIRLSGSPQIRINSPEDAANELQFNAFLLAPFQVEILFALCTMLGGRRKIDTQNILGNRRLIPILDDLFHRLPFGWPRSDCSAHDATSTSSRPSDESHGIHGPGCECTPESAMSVQYLRLLHNFCDRDCDDHADRRLLLSPAEREFVFSADASLVPSPGFQPGLLSKVVEAFVSECDDSPYRFWLASCVESYLRGSCFEEQLFVAQSGLLDHLLGHVTSERIHCAGSLQTSFDLLGELCKANVKMLRLVMSRLDNVSFHRLMEVAASNLVDSNVFIRSLVLSVERAAVTESLDGNLCVDVPQRLKWRSKAGPWTRFYLTHSWWDPTRCGRDCVESDEKKCDDSRPTDWFPPFQENAPYYSGPLTCNTASSHEWVFSPDLLVRYAKSDWIQDEPLGIIARFLGVNRTRLLRGLMQVVHFGSINHENICCLNTAIVLMLFAYRRGELRALVEDIGNSHIVDDAFIEGMQSLGTADPLPQAANEAGSESSSNVMMDLVARNFRELLWFWSEYYSHRGRDRISIEFSSHLHFSEWKHVVSILTDDGSNASLVRKPLRLPRSPYHRAPRV